MSQQAVEHCLDRLTTDDQVRRRAKMAWWPSCRQVDDVLAATVIKRYGRFDGALPAFTDQPHDSGSPSSRSGH